MTWGPLIAAWAMPEITAESLIAVDATSGKVLLERAAHTPRYPASTTKILTTLLLIERTLPEETVVAPPDITRVRESSMNLRPGEKVPALDLAYALMLRSANDGTVAAAEHISGSVGEFANLMNERARSIGCDNTNFTNPHGLTESDHVTTAHDLALIGREAMRNPVMRKIVATKRRTIQRSVNTRDTVMVNRNKWLFKDSSANGIKTGYTRPAMECYVGSVARDFPVIDVLLRSDDWQQDHQRLLQRVYSTYRKGARFHQGRSVGQVNIPGAAEPVPAVLTANAYVLYRRDPDNYRQEFVPDPNVSGAVAKGQALGHWVVTDEDDFAQRIPVAAAANVPAAPIAMLSSGTDARVWWLVGMAGVGAVLLGRRRSGRRPGTIRA